jgi:hypothetical protein
MSDRMKTILTSDDGRALPALAEVIAFETQVSEGDAAKLLAAARKDVAAVSAQPGTGAHHGASTPAAASVNHTLGVADMVGGDAGADKIKAGWAKAVANINARFN